MKKASFDDGDRKRTATRLIKDTDKQRSPREATVVCEKATIARGLQRVVRLYTDGSTNDIMAARGTGRIAAHLTVGTHGRP